MFTSVNAIATNLSASLGMVNLLETASQDFMELKCDLAICYNQSWPEKIDLQYICTSYEQSAFLP